MSCRIRVLDELTINQIAAGEVVENAASVIKELVENALDAGATEIEIHFSSGGRGLLRVVDNGCGMSGDDALLCFERHATSKLKTARDLAAIATMGFRGEALPSIAAISKLNLTTATAGDEGAGRSVTIEGGKVINCTSYARPRGTAVEVRSLFYNAPVRQRFQKSIAHESGEICKIVTQLALAHPLVRFELFKEQERILFAPVSNYNAPFSEALALRIASMLGTDLLSSMIPLQCDEGKISIQGYLAGPQMTRPTRAGGYLFVNARPVLSRLVTEAVREGFGTRISAGRFPLFVLHLNLREGLVDVNVHPQKREVRFASESSLRGAIMRAVGIALDGPAPSPNAPLPWEDQTLPSGETPSSSPLPWERIGGPFSINASPLREPISSALTPLARAQAHVQTRVRVDEQDSPPSLGSALFEPKSAIIGILGHYILLDDKWLSPHFETLSKGGTEGCTLLILDAAAARARLIFDSMICLVEKRGRGEAQMLLIPVTVDLLPAEALIIEESLSLLETCGFGIRPLGGTTFLIDALPEHLDAGDLSQLLPELASHLKHCANAAELFARERRIALAASRGAARPVNLTDESAKALLGTLFAAGPPMHGPQGQPIFYRLLLAEIARKFALG